MEQSVNAFNRALTSVAEDQPVEAVRDIQTLVSLDLLSRVVLKTPVDTGRAQGGWQLEVGAIPGPIDRLETNASAVIEAESSKVEQLRFFDVVYIANNVEYIEFLEQGSSKQAPKGIVNISVQETLVAFS